MKTAEGFRNFAGEHCATTALRQVFACQGIKLSEEMLLGLGEGIGFALLTGKERSFPRVSMRGAGLLQLEENVCKRLGIGMKTLKPKTKKQAEKDLVKMLEKKEAVLVYVEIEDLPYVPRGTVCHLGAHAVSVGGFDPEDGAILVADRDESLHRIPLKILTEARYAAHSPSLHDNTMLRFTYPKTLSPIASAIESAAASVASSMLSTSNKHSGVVGIRGLSESILRWPDELGMKEASSGFASMVVLIESSGNGGGGFRKMYGRFLGEASRMLKDPEVATLANSVTGLARKWSTLAGKLRGLKGKEIPSKLKSISSKLSEIADSEEAVWRKQESIFE